MRESQPSEIDPPWHWTECDHWDLQFEGLPKRIPWFDSDPPPPANRRALIEFPAQRLYHAIRAMLKSAPEPPPDPRFAEFCERMELGDELLAAFEKGDFIAAAGVLREMHRVSRPCGSLLFNEAFLARRNGDLSQACELYREATTLCPDVEMTWSKYGKLCEETGDRAEAIRAYREARRVLPNHEHATLALERLGELFRVTTKDDPTPRFVTKEELRALCENDVQTHWSNAEALREVGGRLLRQNFFPDLALSTLTRAVELDPGDVEGRCNLSIALRVHGRLDEAIRELDYALAVDADNPWTLFHLAECYLAKDDVDNAWETLESVLQLDPNHQPTLNLFFLARTDRSPAEKEADLLAWSKPRPAENFPGSWQGHLMLANLAWQQDEREKAVRLAAAASEIAPEEEEVFVTYTGMLSESGEHEWVAALTKPRLRAGERSATAYHRFATALDAMGLRDEAIATLRRASAELELSPEERAGLTDLLDDWTGRFAYGEIEVETLDSARESLRRKICQVVDGKVAINLFETGMGFPQRREIPVEFQKPRSEFDFTIEQRNSEGDPEQTSLGTFTVREIEPTKLTSEKVRLIFHLDEEAQIGVGAFQGQRKLGVTWSLVPPPRHESAELGSQ